MVNTVNVLSSGMPALRLFIRNRGYLVTPPLSQRWVPERSLRALERMLSPMHHCLGILLDRSGSKKRYLRHSSVLEFTFILEAEHSQAFSSKELTIHFSSLTSESTEVGHESSKKEEEHGFGLHRQSSHRHLTGCIIRNAWINLRCRN